MDVTQATLVIAGLSVLAAVLLLGGSLLFFGVVVQRQYPPEARKAKEEPAVDPVLLARRSAAYRLGALVLVALGVLTAAEFAIAVLLASTALLLIAALFKAGLILQYYMHIKRLWSEEGHE